MADFGFKKERISIDRDAWQSGFGNRVPLNDPDMLEKTRLQEQLTKYAEAKLQEIKENPNAVIKEAIKRNPNKYYREAYPYDLDSFTEHAVINPDAVNPDHLPEETRKDILQKATQATVASSGIEVGGAQPQVDAVFRNEDPSEAWRALREASPTSVIRPLERATNVFMLEPRPKEEIEQVLRQVAEDTAGKHLWGTADELLRFKIFDSQANFAEIEPVLEIIQQLRDEGYPIGVEIAIPYSMGKGCDPSKPEYNPYPDEYYVQKALDAAKLAEKYGIPNDLFHVSLKDMIGELNAADAERLVGAIIDAFRENGHEFTLGLHLHDTGLAVDAYAAAIKVCKEKDWPIAFDTVEGKDTGFASTLDVHKKLIEIGVPEGLGLDETEIAILEEMEVIHARIAEKYAVRRIEPGLSGEELRKYHIPGGGSASTVTRIRDSKLAERLGVSDQESVKVIGEALIAVDRLMGHPFAVTPGYQNKLMAAENLVNNMIAEGMLKKGMSFDEMQEVVLTPLSNPQVEDLFLKGLNAKVTDFLQGWMPAAPHPVVREKLPLRDGILIDGLESRLPSIKEAAIELLEQGYIEPSDTQKRVAERLFRLAVKEKLQSEKDEVTETDINEAIELIDGEEKQIEIKRIATERAYQSAVTRGVILGSGEQLKQMLTKPWLKEADPSEYQGRPNAYKRANERFKKGLNPQPDEIEKIREMVHAGKLDSATAKKHVATLLQAEQQEIQASVLAVLSEEFTESVVIAAKEVVDAKGDNNAPMPALKYLTEMLYQQQRKISNDAQAKEGKLGLYPDDARISLALQTLAGEVVSVAKTLPSGSVDLPKLTNAVIEEERNNIESASITAPMPGMITKVLVNPEPGKTVEVKAGDPLFIMEAMKMQHTVRAAKDGAVSEVLMKEKTAVNTGDVVMKQQLEVAVEKAAYSSEVVFDGKAKLIEELQQRLAERNAQLQSRSELLAVKAVEEKSERVELQALADVTPLTASQKRGFNPANKLTPEKEIANKDKVIHIVGNRAGCAAKIVGDLEQRGADVRVLYTEGDKSTPVVKNAAREKAMKIGSYMDQEEIVNLLNRLADENPGKKIAFHPGWGFLSEKDDFVQKVEEQCRDNVLFVGPPSEAMRLAGGKKTFRDIVKEAAPKFNPGYFGCEGSELSKLKAYVEGGFPKGSPMDIIQRANFEKVCNMGGDVMIKAVAGGGGRGIINFKYDDSIDKEANYKNYVNKVLATRIDALKLFHNDEILVEQCIRGKTRHFEVQFAATNGQAIILGSRDCTTQNDGQKVMESNVIEGDYPPELVSQINEAALNTARDLAEKIGYTGIGTLEMLVSDKGVIFLEVNTRLQVEHAVTEEDVYQKTGKRISLPLVNYHMANNESGKSPEEIMLSEFGMTANDIEAANTPGTERVIHYRVNSKYIDLVNGKAIPSWFADSMWPEGISAYIAEQTGASIIQGGLGDGTCDSQIGAILGNKEQAAAAAALLLDFSRLSQVFERAYGGYKNHNNLEAIQDIFPLLFTETGNVRQEFSTRTLDEMLTSVATGEVTLEKKDGLWPGQRVYADGSLASAFQHVYERNAAMAEVEDKKKVDSKEERVVSFADKVSKRPLVEGQANAVNAAVANRSADGGISGFM